MTRAERVALETFPPDVIKTIHGEFDNNAYARALFWKGYDRCMKDVANMIDGLDEAAYKYSFESRPSVYGQVDVIDAFKAGAEWAFGQIDKEAVEGVAEELYTDDEIYCTVGVGTYFKPGDEVYVIPQSCLKK